MDDFVYTKNCPECGKIQFYKSEYILNKSIKNNTKCLYCSNVLRGKSSNRKGCHHTDETKILMSKSKIEIKRTEISRKKQSESRKQLYKDPLEREKLSKKIKEAMVRPDVRTKHLNALHHSQWIKVKTDTDLFYLDGYDKEKNIVLEYDSYYHNKLNQKQKDLIRQQKIIDIIRPKEFWRYNSETQMSVNILENTHDV